MMIARWISTWRALTGMTQSELALRLNVHRTVVGCWERGISPPSPSSAAALRAALDLPPAAFGLPITGCGSGVRFDEPYPMKATLDDMFGLGSKAKQVYQAVRLTPVERWEIENLFPRDTPYELFASYRFIARRFSLEFHSCDEVEAPLLTTGYKDYLPAGNRLRHSLVLRERDATIILQPQVSVALVVQSRRYRLDFLATRVTPNGVVHADIELDGKFHKDTVDDDARRAHGLCIHALRYQNNAVFDSGFADRVLRDLAKFEAKPLRTKLSERKTS